MHFPRQAGCSLFFNVAALLELLHVQLLSTQTYISAVQEVPAVENLLNTLFVLEVDEGESDLLLSLPVFAQLNLVHCSKP